MVDRARMPFRILIAARRKTTRDRIQLALEEMGGFVCASCPNAASAVAAVASARPHVCLVHLDLPGGGLTACRALAARRRPPRILVLAPAGREGDVTAALRAGADGFVVDELDPRHIPAAVVDVAAGKPYLSPASTALLISQLRAPDHRPEGGRK
jgi:DNA-binding NarL/FixJ family response regulator